MKEWTERELIEARYKIENCKITIGNVLEDKWFDQKSFFETK